MRGVFTFMVHWEVLSNASCPIKMNGSDAKLWMVSEVSQVDPFPSEAHMAIMAPKPLGLPVVAVVLLSVISSHRWVHNGEHCAKLCSRVPAKGNNHKIKRSRAKCSH